MSLSQKFQLNISYGGRVIEFFLLAWGVNDYRARVVVERESSSRMMGYNALSNSCTFRKAEQELGLSSGLSNYCFGLYAKIC